jgi:hypothetical protein
MTARQAARRARAAVTLTSVADGPAMTSATCRPKSATRTRGSLEGLRASDAASRAAIRNASPSARPGDRSGVGAYACYCRGNKKPT